MTRLRISLALLLFLASLSAVAEERDYRVNKAFDAEVTQRTEQILKYADADGDSRLSHPETVNARSQITEAMIDRLPASGYISGGEVTIRGMRQKISQKTMDKNADRVVDLVELENFVGFAIAESEKALRTAYDVQFRLTMEDSADEVMKYTWALENERRMKDNWKWHAKAVQQRQATWFEVQARKRAMRAQAEKEIAEARAKADRDAINRETSPGLIPGPEGK